VNSKAREFAIKAHGEQKYGEFPYSVHLDEVATIAKPYGESAEIVAYLHDVIEDTSVTKKERLIGRWLYRPVMPGSIAS
jgi:(p)ppGpp synthase/HD superfamily hydrolase